MVAFIFRVNRTKKTSISQEELPAPCNRGLYPKNHTILGLLKIAPIKSATVERSNSSLRFVKSCFRGTMREDRLNALSLLFIHKDVALDYDAIIDDYAKRNKRRMTFINPLQWIYLWLVLESCPWDAFPLWNFFYYKSSLNLCSKPTFLVVNDQSSQNGCSKYPSQTNWICQFYRETMMPPLPGGCAPAAIASAPASIIKFKRPECTRLHLRELQSQKFSRGTVRPKLPRKVRRSQSWWALSRSYYHCILYL